MDVSIIIINYNTKELTSDCIDSIYNHTQDISFEVILVDNGSTDGSKEYFSRDNRIIYLYEEINHGFGKANNIGIKHSKGKYIFLLNSDALLKSNAVKEFYDYMNKANDCIAFVGTMLKDINNNYIHSYGNFPNLLTGLKWYTIIGILLSKLKISDNTNKLVANKQVDYITGADLFIRRDVIIKYGLFDSDFFMYFEETELQHRYTNYGYKSYIYSKPQIIHLENYSMDQSYTNNHFRKLHISLMSYYLYLKKCKGLTRYYVFRLLFAIICPLWLIYPKYSFMTKLNFIKLAYKLS